MNNPFWTNKYFQIIGGVLLVTLVLFVGAKALAEFGLIKGNQPMYNTVTVTGNGELFAASDIATFSYAVTEQAEEVSAAQTQATEVGNKALEFLKTNGVSSDDIKTTNYSIYPKYEWVPSSVCTAGYCPGGKNVLTGYEVSQTVTVKVRDIKNVGTILAGMGDLGVKDLSSLSFSIDDDKSLRAEARDLAIADAKAQAEKLEKALGVKLTKVIGFYENQDYGYYYGDRGMGGEMMATTKVAPDLASGQNRITANVSVTYEIR